MRSTRTQISKYIADATIKSGFDKKGIKELAKYLLEQKRTDEVNSIVRDIQADWAMAGKIFVNVTSVFPLTDDVRNEIKRQIEKLYDQTKSVIISESIDPNLIGGIVIETSDKELDLSVRSKLNQFRQLIISTRA